MSGWLLALLFQSFVPSRDMNSKVLSDDCSGFRALLRLFLWVTISPSNLSIEFTFIEHLIFTKESTIIFPTKLQRIVFAYSVVCKMKEITTISFLIHEIYSPNQILRDPSSSSNYPFFLISRKIIYEV